MMSTPTLLEALDAVIEAGEGATPGVWLHERLDVVTSADGGYIAEAHDGMLGTGCCMDRVARNARFIAASANLSRHAPALRALVEENERLRAALEDALPYVREASETVGYGFFNGGDPRDFSPDHECCSEEEIAAWKAACEVYEANREALKNPSEWLKTEDGKRFAHVLRAPFGMGTYVIRDRDGMDLVGRIANLTTRAALQEPTDGQ